MRGVFAGHEVIGGFAGAGGESEEVFTSDFESMGLVEAEGDRVLAPDVDGDFGGIDDDGMVERKV